MQPFLDLQHVRVPSIRNIRLATELRVLLDKRAQVLHVGGQAIGNENDERVLVLQPLDHFLSVEHVVCALRVHAIGGRLVQHTDVTDLL